MTGYKKLLTIAVSASLALSLAACSSAAPGESTTEKGLKAFNLILETYPDRQGFHEELRHWGFEVPTGEKFEWIDDMSANKADFAMVLEAQPLISAGLDVTKLDQALWIYEPAGKDSMGMEQPARLILPTNISDSKLPMKTAGESMKALLEAAPGKLMFHGDMDHFVLTLNGANEVIWTEQLDLNDTDMAFVLEAGPLVAAGLDLAKLEGTGWTFKKADPVAKTPDQIIRTFDLKK